jgi:hypothetical protein
VIVELVLFAVLAAAILLVHWRAQRRLAAGVDQRAVEREKAQDKHLKAITRDAERTRREVEAALGEVRHLHEDARLLHERTDVKLAELNRGG